jgi:hypothetical protein
MTECPNCEYLKKRVQLWRDEAYRLGGHPLPDREWVGLTDEEIQQCLNGLPTQTIDVYARRIEAKLKEKNT